MRSVATSSFLCLTLLAPAVGSAQGPVEWRSGLPIGTKKARSVRDSPRLGLPADPNTAYGTQLGAKFIGATEFSGVTSGAPPLALSGPTGFFVAPGVADTTGYSTQLDLEPGVLVQSIACIYFDGSATNDGGFGLVRYAHTVDPDSVSSELLAAETATGTPGIHGLILDPDDFTFRTADNLTAYTYVLAAGAATDIGLLGCWVYYQRQVAPAPAIATFGDVPTSSPYFPFVEALVEANVVAGCGGGDYCPNDPVTRGQMAVYVAAALGMGYPW